MSPNALDINLGGTRKRFLELEPGHPGDNVDSPGRDSNLDDRIVLLEIANREAVQRSPTSTQRLQRGGRIVRRWHDWRTGGFSLVRRNVCRSTTDGPHVGVILEQNIAGERCAISAYKEMLAAAEDFRTHGHRDASLKMASRAVDWYRSRVGEEAKREETRSGLGDSLYQAERWQEAKVVFAALAAEHRHHVEEAVDEGLGGQ